LPRKWNNGISGRLFLKGYYPFLILSSTYILSLTQHRIIPEPFIPSFHHSNWGEAPNLGYSFSFIEATVKDIAFLTVSTTLRPVTVLASKEGASN
jgi:hypothetical protein